MSTLADLAQGQEAWSDKAGTDHGLSVKNDVLTTASIQLSVEQDASGTALVSVVGSFSRKDTSASSLLKHLREDVFEIDDDESGSYVDGTSPQTVKQKRSESTRSASGATYGEGTRVECAGFLWITGRAIRQETPYGTTSHYIYPAQCVRGPQPGMELPGPRNFTEAEMYRYARTAEYIE